MKTKDQNEKITSLNANPNNSESIFFTSEDYYRDPKKIVLDKRNQAIVRCFTLFHHALNTEVGKKDQRIYTPSFQSLKA